MKVIATYLLALLGGNSSPSAKDIRAILESVGADAEDARIALLISELEGKDILEVIASGKHQLASVPARGGGRPAVSAPTGHVPAAAAVHTAYWRQLLTQVTAKKNS